MDWTPGGISSDIEDRRGDQSYGPGFGGFGFGGGGIGIVGILVLLVISVVTGHNFLGAVLGGGSAAPVQQSQYGDGQPGYGPQQGYDAQPQRSATVQQSPAEARDVQLISFVLDDVQKTWTKIFAAEGRTYRHAKLVLFRNATYSGCGTAQAATGPFYCPADGKVYIDLSFWDELKKFGGNTGDFAQAYVVAHELGHHVQDLLGTEQRLQSFDQRNPSQRNAESVKLELQADCFAGVWAHDAKERGIVDTSDIAGGMQAAAAVGDDHLQKMAGRAVSPDSFTHGTSAQRQHWLETGLDSGDPAACNTFGNSAGN